MLKCKICGKEFEANLERHYIARDNGKSGLTVIVSNDEVKLYDAFDCPSCGCQVIAQERKRNLVVEDFEEDEEELDAEEDKEEHDGCCGCKYEDKLEYQFPCSSCKGTAENDEQYYGRKDCFEEKRNGGTNERKRI